MCGRYASSRQPEDLVEEFEVVDSRLDRAARARLQRGADQGGLRRDGAPALHGDVTRGAARAPAPVARWGLVPSWAKDPSIGSRMINARMETVAEKPAYKRAFAGRRCLLPADGYFEWYATSEQTKAGKPPQAAVLHPPGRRRGAGDGRALRDLARPDPRATTTPSGSCWTCTVLTTEAEDDARAHPRPDAADGRARPRGPPGSTRATRAATTCSTCWCRRPRAGWRPTPSRPLVGNVRNNGPELVEPIPLEESTRMTESRVPTPPRRRPAPRPTGPGGRSRPCC